METFTKFSLSLKKIVVDTTDWQILHSKYFSEEEVVLQHHAKDKISNAFYIRIQNGKVFRIEFGKAVGHRLQYFV